MKAKAGKKPLFREEGPEYYGKALKHNQRWATHDAPWSTDLNAHEERRFRTWLQKHNDPGGFNPKAKRQDYDLRGYWKRTKGKTWEQGGHFPDTWKTPYDTTFSNQSKYAKPGTPYVWRGNTLVNRKNGRVIFR